MLLFSVCCEAHGVEIDTFLFNLNELGKEAILVPVGVARTRMPRDIQLPPLPSVSEASVQSRVSKHFLCLSTFSRTHLKIACLLPSKT